MVTKKTTAVKAKSSTSNTGKAAKKPPLKAELKASPAKSLRSGCEGSGCEGSGCQGPAQGQRQGRAGGREAAPPQGRRSACPTRAARPSGPQAEAD